MGILAATARFLMIDDGVTHVAKMTLG